MSRWPSFIETILIAGFLVSTPAFADDRDTCATASGERPLRPARARSSPKKFKGRDLATVYANRGHGYLIKGEHDRMIADLNEAIRLDPKAIRLDPKHPSEFNDRGTTYYDKGEHDHAIAYFAAAIRLDPTYALAYRNRGGAYHAKGEHDRAIADCNEAIRLDPNNAAGYSNRGAAYNAKGERYRAIADYTKAIQFDPKFAPAFYNRGAVYKDMGEHDQAIADYDEAIRLDPEFTAALTGRGLLTKLRTIESKQRSILVPPSQSLKSIIMANGRTTLRASGLKRWLCKRRPIRYSTRSHELRSVALRSSSATAPILVRHGSRTRSMTSRM